MRYDFLGVGGLSYDLVLRVAHLPLADDKYPARLVGKLPGGFIANATCAAARLGLSAGYAGWIGDDADGDMLREAFVACGVDPAGLVQVPGAVTPFTVVITDESGHRSIVLPSFPLYDRPLEPNQLALVEQARAVLTFPRDATWCDHLRARARGLLALDVESAAPLRGAALRQAVDMAEVVFLKPESLALMGVSSLRDLVRPGQWLIVTAGRDGGYGLEAGMVEPIHQPALAMPVVDSTGAGDCFHAAVCAARLDGATLGEALRFANAAAAIKVQSVGARGGLPTRDQVNALL